MDEREQIGANKDNMQQSLELVCADVINAVQDYCDDGIDAFQDCLAEAPGLAPDALAIIQQGITSLHQQLTKRVTSSLALFEHLCHTALPAVPLAPQQALIQAQSPTSGQTPVQGSSGDHINDANPQLLALNDQHKELDAQLAELKTKLQQENQECEALMKHIEVLDAQLHDYGSVTGYVAVGAVAEAGGSTVLEDLKAIHAAKSMLEPLLQRASQLRNQQQAAAIAKGATQQLRVPSADMPVLGSLDNLPDVNLLMT